MKQLLLQLLASVMFSCASTDITVVNREKPQSPYSRFMLLFNVSSI